MTVMPERLISNSIKVNCCSSPYSGTRARVYEFFKNIVDPRVHSCLKIHNNNNNKEDF